MRMKLGWLGLTLEWFRLQWIQNWGRLRPGANLAFGNDDVESSLIKILSCGDEKECGRDVVHVQLEIMPGTALQAVFTINHT